MIGGQVSWLGTRIAIGGKLMAMIGALISVDEYLHTVYHPDCDYVDGALAVPLAEIFAALYG